MSFTSLMRHIYVHEQRVSLGTLDEDGHTETGIVEAGTFRGTAQMKQARELDWASRGGTVLYDYDLFTTKGDLSTLDRVWHDPARCNARNDLPDLRYEVRTAVDDADRGHHYKYDARITTAEPYPEGS